MAQTSADSSGNEEIAQVVGSLQNTFEGIQKTFSVASVNLANNLAKSVSALQSMNTVMEQFLQAAVQLSTTVEWHDGSSAASSLTVAVNVTNMGPVPITGITLQLSARARHAPQDAVLFQVVAVNGTAAASTPLQHFELPLGTLSARSAPHTVRLDIALPSLTQFNAEFRAVFVSPGTGAQLQSVHQVGFYLVDQCRCEFDAGGETLQTAQGARLNATEFRRVCRVRPMDGIQTGTNVIFRNQRDMSIVGQLCIMGTADHGATIVVCASSSKQQHPVDLSLLILDELVQLCAGVMMA